MSTDTTYAIKIRAKNTPSGNPNRGWLVYTAAGELIEFIDEGYNGRQALSWPYPEAIELAVIDTSSTDVNRARKNFTA